MTLTELRNLMAYTAERVRREKPLIGDMTNTVTVNWVVNAQLAVGGTAAAFYLPDEAEHFARQADGFYLNLGTLMPVYAESVPLALKALRDKGTPWVLDPVGIGVGQLRRQLLLAMRESAPSIIRGNASEIIALADLWGVQAGALSVRGVDSTVGVDDAQDAAIALARHTGGAVAVSGERDLVTNGKLLARCSGGSERITHITGGGCAQGGVMAVYAAATRPFAAALMGSAAFKCAAKQGARRALGAGSFMVQFLDELERTTGGDISAVPFEVNDLSGQ